MGGGGGGGWVGDGEGGEGRRGGRKEGRWRVGVGVLVGGWVEGVGVLVGGCVVGGLCVWCVWYESLRSRRVYPGACLGATNSTRLRAKGT